jgi:hypothetical protein
MRDDAPESTEWRCRKCRTLLGERVGDRLYLRFRKFQFVVLGVRDAVVATCGNCFLTDEAPGRIGLTPNEQVAP